MNERQLQLIMQIVREQLSDYLAEALVDDLDKSIEEAISDNLETFDLLGNEDQEAEDRE